MTECIEELVYSWYERSQIDYSDLYARLYISYNAWFRKVTRTSNDSQALELLKRRFIIWDDYIHNRTMRDLTEVISRICRHTETNVKDTSDWRGLISFWYQVRCDLFHGTIKPDNEIIRLAYESLVIFMDEIVSRMHQSFPSGYFFAHDLWSVDMMRVLPSETLYIAT